MTPSPRRSDPRPVSGAPWPAAAMGFLLLLTLLSACGGDSQGEDAVAAAAADDVTTGPSRAPNTLTDDERAEGWRLLFDGRSLDGWKGYRSEDAPESWAAVDGILTRVGEGGDLLTREQYGDFELALEWRIAAGGNSGILYRGDESADWLYETAPEMQVLDDAGHPDGASPLTSAGSVFALYPVPRGVVRSAGEWNRARIVAQGPHVEHWLNGVKVAEYEQGSDAWNRTVADSKFRQWPGFGTLMRGYIGLQEHGDRVEYRSIRIRELE